MCSATGRNFSLKEKHMATKAILILFLHKKITDVNQKVYPNI